MVRLSLYQAGHTETASSLTPKIASNQSARRRDVLLRNMWSTQGSRFGHAVSQGVPALKSVITWAKTSLRRTGGISRRPRILLTTTSRATDLSRLVRLKEEGASILQPRTWLA